MQEPLNFSCTPAYSATQELAARLLNSLQTHNCGSTTSPPLTFDLRPSSLVGDNLTCGGGGGGGQTTSLLPYPWTTFPSSALVAAAATAAISMKTATTTNPSNCLREAISLETSTGGDYHPALKKAVSDHKFLSRTVTMTADLCGSLSQIPNVSVPLEPIDITVTQEVESDFCTPASLNRRNSKHGERGRGARVVIHQFGDAEDHFSKALRKLHVKSACEYEIPEGASQKKSVWTLTSTFDDGDGRIETSDASPSFEAQDIADLAVEKHFEKSLATFHAKQAAAAAAATSTTVLANEAPSKKSLDLIQTPFSPSSPSTNSSSDREECGGPSFNPKKKWLAQYGDDEGARIRVGRKSGTLSLDDNAWNSRNTTASTNIEKRSRSCPFLLNDCTHSVKTLLHWEPKCEPNSNNTAKHMGFSRTVAVKSSISSLQLAKRGFSTLARTISLEVPSLGASIDFFDDEDVAVVASKSISARESPVSSPIAASSGFFTDSTFSLDSSHLPVISEAGYFSSNASVSSSFKARHLAVLREDTPATRPKGRSIFGCESDDVAETNATSSHGRCWPLRKRTASDASDLSCLKRSRSVVDTGCGNHA